MQVCILSAILWPWYAWYAGVYFITDIGMVWFGIHGMQVCILSAILWPWYAWYAGMYCYGEILDWCHPLMMNVWVNCKELKLTFKILCLDIDTCRLAAAGAGGWCVCRWDLRMCLLFIRWCTFMNCLIQHSDSTNYIQKVRRKCCLTEFCFQGGLF